MTASGYYLGHPINIPRGEPHQYWRPSIERVDIMPPVESEIQQLYDRKPTKPDLTPQKLYEWE